MQSMQSRTMSGVPSSGCSPAPPPATAPAARRLLNAAQPRRSQEGQMQAASQSAAADGPSRGTTMRKTKPDLLTTSFMLPLRRRRSSSTGGGSRPAVRLPAPALPRAPHSSTQWLMGIQAPRQGVATTCRRCSTGLPAPAAAAVASSGLRLSPRSCGLAAQSRLPLLQMRPPVKPSRMMVALGSAPRRQPSAQPGSASS